MPKLLIPIACLALFAGTIAFTLGRGQTDEPPPKVTNPATARMTHVDAHAASALVAKPGVVVLDVRTPGEFSSGHIAGANLVDFRSPDFKQTVGQLDRKASYLLHCASGGRSQQALAVMEELGFQSVAHLDGGFIAWQKAGQAVAR